MMTSSLGGNGDGECGESRGIVKTARRILVVTSAKQRPLGPRILPSVYSTPVLS